MDWRIRNIAAISGLLIGTTATSQKPSLVQGSVEVQMRNVRLHLDRFTVLEIKALRGQMAPTGGDRPVTFDDPNSFVTRILTGEITISLDTLADLLNRRVFAYPGAPLKNIKITAEKGRIKQTGTMHKGIDLPFEIEGTLQPTPNGELVLHADKVASAHVPVKGLLHLFGEDLSKLVNVREDRGVRLEGDDIFLRPNRLLPPPRIEGAVSYVKTESDRVVLTFGAGGSNELNPPYKADAYMYHRGGILRFGKLTMNDSDLEIVSEANRSPFDFSLPDYDQQLQAGYSKNTPSHGLIVFMRDFNSLPQRSNQSR